VFFDRDGPFGMFISGDERCFVLFLALLGVEVNSAGVCLFSMVSSGMLSLADNASSAPHGAPVSSETQLALGLSSYGRSPFLKVWG
jgi:hypothetical protein